MKCRIITLSEHNKAIHIEDCQKLVSEEAGRLSDCFPIETPEGNLVFQEEFEFFLFELADRQDLIQTAELMISSKKRGSHLLPIFKTLAAGIERKLHQHKKYIREMGIPRK